MVINIIIMNCYECGEYGHKREMCPIRNEKISNTKCYECGELGHYKKECLYVGLVNKKILNLEEIKQFILSIPACTNCKLYTEIGNVFFTTHSDNIWFKVGKNNNSKPNIDLCEILNKYIRNIDHFIVFAQKKGIVIKIEYDTFENNLKKMIYELHNQGLCQKENYGSNREDHYKINNEIVMISHRHHETWKPKIVKDNKIIVCDEYDKYKNDGRNSLQDIMPVKNEIIFLYADDKNSPQEKNKIVSPCSDSLRLTQSSWCIII